MVLSPFLVVSFVAKENEFPSTRPLSRAEDIFLAAKVPVNWLPWVFNSRVVVRLLFFPALGVISTFQRPSKFGPANRDPQNAASARVFAI